MTSLLDLRNLLPEIIVPKLAPSGIKALLLTSKGLYTLISNSMAIVYEAQFPNEPVDPNTTNCGSYWMQRYLARIAARHVFVWGDNSSDRLCLSSLDNNSANGHSVVWPARSEKLSSLGVKKIAGRGFSLVALSVEGKVFITADDNLMPFNSNAKLHARLFECECPNEFIVDVVAAREAFVAISDNGSLYTRGYATTFIRPPQVPSNHKLVKVDLARSLGLATKPHILAVSAHWTVVACLVEDVGVVVWEQRETPEENYAPQTAFIPYVSNSMESEWKVVDIGAGDLYLVLVLANGLIYTVDLDTNDGVISSRAPKPFDDLAEPISRVWCARNRFLALSYRNVLFEIKVGQHNDHTRFKEPTQVKGIDAARISTIALGDYHNLALLEDGTLYTWGRQPGNSGAFGLGPNPQQNTFRDRVLKHPVKIALEHVVSVAASGWQSAAIVLDLNEAHKTAVNDKEV